MPKKLFSAICLAMLAAAFVVVSNAQTRQSVSAAEVNGTFRMPFKGKFKGSYNEIKILALGKGKLRVAFDLTYPYIDGAGALSANVGQAEGEAEIEGDTAVFTSEEFGACKITIKFVRPGEIRVAQEQEDAGCGFGHNVSAEGTYKKFSAAKPKF
jgi:hypothetical protein